MIISAPRDVRNSVVLLGWAMYHVTSLRFGRILQVWLFYQFMVFFMYSAVICRYCICYEQPSFPKRSGTIFWTYKINIKFDLKFWWLSIVSLTRLWNGVGPHGWREPGFVIVNFGLLFHPGKIILLFSRPWILLLWTVWQCIEYCLWFS